MKELEYSTDTVLQRHNLYKAMVQEVEDNLQIWCGSGFCKLLYSFNIDTYGINHEYIMSRFEMYVPELAVKLPKIWYSLISILPTDNIGWDCRLSLIKQCVEETKTE